MKCGICPKGKVTTKGCTCCDFCLRSIGQGLLAKRQVVVIRKKRK